MEKRTLEDLIVKEQPSDSRVVSLRVKAHILDKLKKKGIDVTKTLQALLARMAD